MLISQTGHVHLLTTRGNIAILYISIANFMSIQTFGDSRTEKIFNGTRDKEVSKFPQDVLKVAERKLDMLDAAKQLKDLGSPPANMLERLKGQLKDYWSIRINDQWRVIFIWTDQGPLNVKIVDYH